MYRRKTIVCLLLALSCTLGYAQIKKTLTLNEALALSQKNSKQLKLAQLQIEQANAQISEAQDQQLPELKISGQGDYLPSINTSIPALSGMMTGGPKVDYLGLANASISVPLFTGFKISNGIAIAKYNKQLQQSSYTAKEQDVMMQTIEAFVNLYKTKEAQKVVLANLARAQETERNYTNLEQNGLVAKNDLLRVQLQVTNVELALAETKKNSNVLNYNLNLLLGLPDSTDLEPQLDFSYTPVALSNAAYEKQALDHREEFQAIKIQQQISEKNVAIAKGSYYPNIALSGSDMFIHVHNLGNITNATMVGIGISYDLSSLFKNGHKVNAAQSQLLQAAESQSLLSDQIRAQIHSAFQDYEYNIQRTQVYEKALEQASENYRIVSNKQKNGLANTDDLLTADVAQLQAELNKAYSQADVMLSYYKLLKQAGIISSINKK